MKIGLALVGAGAVVVERHLPAIGGFDGAAVRAVYDPDATAAARVAAATGARIAGSLADVVNSDSVGAVVVASPNAFHRAAVEAAAAAGKHIFCEKPIATNLRDARAMIDAAARAGVLLQIGFHHRFTSEHRLVRRLLDAGVIGAVRTFHVEHSEPLDLVPAGGNYRFRPELAGGLTLIDFGSHHIDQLRALAGDVAEVSAQLANVDASHGLDDNVTLGVKTASGALGTFGFHRFSRGAVMPTTLIGAKGVICFSAFAVNPFHVAPVAVFTEESLPSDALVFRRGPDWWNAPSPGWTALWPPVESSFAGQYRAFFASVAGGAPPPVSGEDGYKALEIVLAAYKSSRTARAVALPLSPEEEIPLPTLR